MMSLSAAALSRVSRATLRCPILCSGHSPQDQLLSAPTIPILSSRLIFSGELLGTDKFAEMRRRSKQQFGQMREKFITRMEEYMLDDNTSMVFTEDLKNVIMLLEDNVQEQTLLKAMISKFNSQNESLRFGSFIFGPVVMRMVHHLGNADLGLELFKDPKNKGFFDQLTSYTILGDLLFEQGRYEDVIALLPALHEAGFSDTQYPKDLMLLVLASCYKIGTREAYDRGLEFLAAGREVGAAISGKSAALFGALALRMGEPKVALELVSLTGPNYITTKNLRIMAMAAVGRPEDALQILRQHLNIDLPHKPLGQICVEAVDALTKAIEKREDPLITQEFHQVCRALKEGNHLSDKTLDEILLTPVSGAKAKQQRSSGGVDAFDYQNRMQDAEKFGRQRQRNMYSMSDREFENRNADSVQQDRRTRNYVDRRNRNVRGGGGGGGGQRMEKFEN